MTKFLRKIRNLTTYPLAILFILSFALVAMWFYDDKTMATAESGFPFYNLNFMSRIASYSWTDLSLGNDMGMRVAAKPTYWFLAQLENLGLPTFLIQATFFFLIFFSAGAGVYFLTKELFPRISSRYYLTASLFYWFSPFSLVGVWNRFLNNYMVFWALLPISLALFISGIKKKDYRYAVLASLSTVIYSFALTSIVFDILLWFLLTYTFLFFLVSNKNSVFFHFKYFGIAVLTFVLFNSWWLASAVNYAFSTSLSVSVGEFFSTQGNLSTLSAISRISGNFINTVRLMEGGFYQSEGPPWSRIYTIPAFVAFEFVVSGIILFSIYRFRKVREGLFLGLLFITALFLVKGNANPFGEVFQYIFSKFVFLQGFRNPFEKFGFLLPLAASPLFALGVNEIFEGVSLGKRKIFLLFTLFFLVFFWGLPFLTGRVFTFFKPRIGILRSYKTEVPSYYREVNEWLKTESGGFRFVSLPLKGEGITYSWKNGYSGVEFSNTLFETPNISNNTNIPFYYEFVSELSKYQRSEKLLSFFPYLSGKYILWRGDIDYKDRAMADPDKLKGLLDSWAEKGLLIKRLEEGKLAIYEVGGKWLWPKVYMANNLLISNEVDFSDISQGEPSFPQQKLAVIDSKNTNKLEEVGGNYLIKPSWVFLPHTTKAISTFTEEDLMARLFHAKHLPNEKFYFLIGLKEKLEAPPKSDYLGWILYQVGLLGKRAVEIYKLTTQNAEPKFISKAESGYVKDLEGLRLVLSDTLKTDTPESSVVKDSLLYQLLLLEKSHSKASTALAEMLIAMKVRPKFDLPKTESKDFLVYHFDIPSSGDYNLLLGQKTSSLDWFLDSKQLNFREGNRITLAAGVHEVVIPYDDNNLLKPIIEEDEVSVGDNSLKTWEISLPTTPQTYRLEFDFRFRKGNAFNLKLIQDVNREESPLFADVVRKDPSFHEWKHWTVDFSTSDGASNLSIETSTFKDDMCKRNWWGKMICQEKDQEFDVDIRSFKMSQLNYPEISFTTSFAKSSVTNSIATDLMEVNPAFYKVKVSKEDSNPEMIVFSELFDSGWKASLRDGSVIPETKHYLVNSYANGWLIDKKGDYEIEIKFQPQEALRIGQKISFVSLLGGIIFLGFTTWKKRWRQN